MSRPGWSGTKPRRDMPAILTASHAPGGSGLFSPAEAKGFISSSPTRIEAEQVRFIGEEFG
jgi:hypothetical protein